MGTSLVVCWLRHSVDADGSEMNLGTGQPGWDVMRTMALPKPFGSETRINPAAWGWERAAGGPCAVNDDSEINFISKQGCFCKGQGPVPKLGAYGDLRTIWPSTGTSVRDKLIPPHLIVMGFFSLVVPFELNRELHSPKFHRHHEVALATELLSWNWGS